MTMAMTMTLLEALAVVRAIQDGDSEIDFAPVEIVEPAQPVPELPAEVWHTTEADGDARMRAVRALSRAA